MTEKAIQRIAKERNVFCHPLMPWIVLITSLFLTYAAFKVSNDIANDRAFDQFDFQARRIVSGVEKRLKLYEQVLRSGVALFNASKFVDRKEWKTFVDTLDIHSHWPGIQGIGYARVIKPDALKDHIKATRSEGFPEYSVRPKDKRSQYTAIVYIEPFDWRNKRAFGYDMFTNDVRREAMIRARDQGVAATSGIITLVQETEEDVQKGFLTYLPVYRSKNVPEAIVDKRKEFMGWVYAPYRSGDLLKSVMEGSETDIEFEIFDGRVMSAETLLYDSDETLHFDVKDHQPKFSKLVNINLQGRPWTMYFYSDETSLYAREKKLSFSILIAGLLVDLILFYAIYVLRRVKSTLDQRQTVV